MTCPIVRRQLAVLAFDTARPSAVASASGLAFVLAIVLHRAIPEMNQFFFATFTSFDHHLFAGACASAWFIARHFILVDS
jgi:hypothetical protein